MRCCTFIRKTSLTFPNNCGPKDCVERLLSAKALQSKEYVSYGVAQHWALWVDLLNL